MLRALGIRHILARSPEARGRSERAFGTIQGRLPQELRLAGINAYADANSYLGTTFVPDFNRRFTVAPAEPESAFTPLAGIDLELLLSVQQSASCGTTTPSSSAARAATPADEGRTTSPAVPSSSTSSSMATSPSATRGASSLASAETDNSTEGGHDSKAA